MKADWDFQNGRPLTTKLNRLFFNLALCLVEIVYSSGLFPFKRILRIPADLNQTPGNIQLYSLFY